MNEQPQQPQQKGFPYFLTFGSIWIQFLFRTNFGDRYLKSWFINPATHVEIIALIYLIDPEELKWMPMLGPFSIVVSIRMIWEMVKHWFSPYNPNKHSHHMGRPILLLARLPFPSAFIFTFIEPIPIAIFGFLCLYFKWDIWFGYLLLFVSLGHLAYWLKYAEKEDSEVIDIRDQLLDSKRRQRKIEEAQGMNESDDNHYAQ